jgi:ABC-type multidrug transport system fused ATPase/permease subunit
MPLLFLGFFLLTLIWLVWAIAWVVVWAVVLLAWPVAFLIGGVLLWRGLMRRSQRSVGARAQPAGGNGAVHNSAFEDYRRETIARLDEERAKFREFLQRLRRSRDKQEFEAFMAGRRGRPAITQGDAV